MNIVILGPQGSGKGTQAELLTKNAGYFHMESGKILRQMAKTDPRIHEIINVRGELYPDRDTIALIENHLEANGIAFDNVVFDGFPRTVVQYRMLAEWLSTKGKTIDKVIYITLSEDETIRRLTARRTCDKCGTVYNLITNPPPSDGCPCGGKLTQREDDKPETIKKRLMLFGEQTLPIVELAKEEGKLVEINGERPIGEIQKDIITALGESQ